MTLKTRKGLDWTGKFDAIAHAATGLPDGLIDGEIVALNANGAPDFAALQAALSEGKTKDLIFFAFDLLFDGDEDLRKRPLSKRKHLLKKMFVEQSDRGVIRFVEHFETGGEAVLRFACKLSLEGIVSKKVDAHYQSGRSDAWTKAKCRAGHEVVVGGWSTTNGRFRSLLVGVNRGDHFVYVGRVGTGYGETAVRNLLPRLKSVAAAKSPFTGIGAPRKEAGVTWTSPSLSPRSNSPAGPGTAWCGKRRSKACERTKRQKRLKQKSPPSRPRRMYRHRRGWHFLRVRLSPRESPS